MSDLMLGLTDEEFEAMRDTYMCRCMFNPMVGWPPETRTLEEYAAAWKAQAEGRVSP